MGMARRRGGWRGLGAACLVFLSSATLAAEATPEVSSATAWVEYALAAALSICVIAIAGLFRQRRALSAALAQLAGLAAHLRSGEATQWRDCGIAEIDAAAHLLDEQDTRLRAKRLKLQELGEQLVNAARGAGAQAFNGQLQAIIDAIPVGVVLAEAPSGRIVEGNRAIETILRRPVIFSKSADTYGEWTAVHENGRPVENAEYPLARALAGEERPVLECHYKRGDGVFVWISVTGAPLRNENQDIVGAIAAVTDIDDIKSAEARERSMNLELHHRVNNTLAVIQGVANVTLRASTDLECFRRGFSERILCLSRISTLLVKNSWERTPLKELLVMSLATADGLGDADVCARISLTGDDADLRSDVALALGVALQELRANAKRFGALSAPDGRVAIDWRIDAQDAKRRLLLQWIESGGPTVAQPQRSGVGYHLMKHVLARQLGGDIEIFFEPCGVRATITAEI